MLSREYVRILRWFESHKEQYYSEYQINQLGIKTDYMELDWLYRHDFLIRYMADEPYCSDFEPPPYMYRISPGGSSKLAEYKSHIFKEIRAWSTLGIAILAFFLSILSIWLQYAFIYSRS